VAADRRPSARQEERSGSDGIGQPAVRERCSLGSTLRRALSRSALSVRQVKTIHKRFGRWADKGVWERIFSHLIDDPDNDYVMLDTTLIRAHQQAAGGKGGRAIRRWGVPEED
jgi:transposase